MKSHFHKIPAILILSLSLFCCGRDQPRVVPVTSFTIELNNSNDKIFSSCESVFQISCSDTGFILPETTSQKVLKYKSDGVSTIMILHTGENKSPENGNTASYLGATQYLDISNPDITATASRFRNSSDPVREISRFVNIHITDKKIGIPLLPASVIFQNHAGDCTEHSVLTAALLRATGIPARCVAGAILVENFQGKKNIFVYHMWVEAYHGGKWLLVDSTRPDMTCCNRYIAFAYHSMETELPIDYLTSLSYLTDVSITAVN